MMRKIFCLLDTSYLTELFMVSTKSNKGQHEVVIKNIASFSEQGAKFFITAPVLFELARHIAQAKKSDRYMLAKKFGKLVKDMDDRKGPFYVYPGASEALLHIEHLVHLANRFIDHGAVEQLSLADIDIARVVEALSEKYPKHQIKILTFDEKLSAYSVYGDTI